MKTFYAVALFVLLISCASPTTNNLVESDINIIPKPAQLTLNKGNFVFNENTIIVANKLYRTPAELLNQKLSLAAGFNLSFS